MNQVGYLILAISIIIGLAIIFVTSFVLYKRTPVPKGCEDLIANEGKCAGCDKECAFKSKEVK